MPKSATGQHRWEARRSPTGEPYRECSFCAIRAHWEGASSPCTNATLARWRTFTKKKAAAAKKAEAARPAEHHVDPPVEDAPVFLTMSQLIGQERYAKR
jgi:hypothetical protein